MCSIDKLKIDLKDIDDAEVNIQTPLPSDAFTDIPGSEIIRSDMQVSVSIRKSTHFFEVSISATGTVEIPCHRCLDPMTQPVNAQQQLIVKLGEQYSEDDNIITVSEDDPTLDISWIVYEATALAIPVKHVHAPGKCNPAMMNVLNEHSATRSDDEGNGQPVDPRWSKLRDLQIES